MASVTRKQLLILLGALTVALYVVLALIDPSTNGSGPSIVSLEFAGSAGRVAEIFAEWGDHGRDLARLSLWLDFAFMAAYGAFLALAALATRDFAAATGRGALATAGRYAPAAAIGAALFDAAENILWLLLLGGRGGDVAPPVATACASVKFLLLLLAIAYCLWGLAARLRR